MTQVAFQDGAPNAGTAFDFTAQLTASMIDYLASSNANSNLNSLGDFFSYKSVMFRASSLDAPSPNESPKNYPLVYLKTTPTKKEGNAKAMWVSGQTDLSVWSSKPNPLEAVAECVQVAGATASKLKQSILDGNATDWSQWYSNDYREVVNRITASRPVMETDSQGQMTGRAFVKLTAYWSHFETV